MPAQKHVHRYERAYLGKKGTYKVWRCNLPDCSHYTPDKLIKGKTARCNRCDATFVLDARALALEKPHCVDCIEVRKKPSHDALLDFVEANDRSKTK